MCPWQILLDESDRQERWDFIEKLSIATTEATNHPHNLHSYPLIVYLHPRVCSLSYKAHRLKTMRSTLQFNSQDSYFLFLPIFSYSCFIFYTLFSNSCFILLFSYIIVDCLILILFFFSPPLWFLFYSHILILVFILVLFSYSCFILILFYFFFYLFLFYSPNFVFSLLFLFYCFILLFYHSILLFFFFYSYFILLFCFIRTFHFAKQVKKIESKIVHKGKEKKMLCLRTSRLKERLLITHSKNCTDYWTHSFFIAFVLIPTFQLVHSMAFFRYPINNQIEENYFFFLFLFSFLPYNAISIETKNSYQCI